MLLIGLVNKMLLNRNAIIHMHHSDKSYHIHLILSEL